MGQLWLAKGLISLLRLAQLYIPGETKAVVDFVSSSLTRLPAVSGSFGCFVSGCGGETKIKVWLWLNLDLKKGTVHFSERFTRPEWTLQSNGISSECTSRSCDLVQTALL